MSTARILAVEFRDALSITERLDPELSWRWSRIAMIAPASMTARYDGNMLGGASLGNSWSRRS
jgi:hypothetical protein